MKTLLLALFVFVGCTPPVGQPAAADARGEPSQPRFSDAALARAVHAETNRVRRGRSLAALTWEGRLEDVARDYSRDMARRGFFDHVDPDGRDPTARAAVSGFTCRRATGPNTWREGVGENLARMSLYRSYTETTSAVGTSRQYDWYTRDALARSVVAGWMDSPGHRRNLLSVNYRAEALGVHVARNGAVYVTQAFC